MVKGRNDAGNDRAAKGSDQHAEAGDPGESSGVGEVVEARRIDTQIF